MYRTVKAIIDINGNVTLLEEVKLERTHRALVTILGPMGDPGDVWDNDEDDVYSELLKQ